MIRRRVVLRCLIVAIGFMVLSTPSTSYEAQTPAPAMLHAAQAFLSTLSPVEFAQATMPFDTDERYNWFYTPVDRKGLPF